MRWISLLVVAATTLVPMAANGHHPEREKQPVRPYWDVIGPLGTHLPMSYRRKYNRPSNWMGRMAYYVAPSSQEAMAWHRATHKGFYKDKRPRMITHYFYPKPWEALKIGARGHQASKQMPTVAPQPASPQPASPEPASSSDAPSPQDASSQPDASGQPDARPLDLDSAAPAIDAESVQELLPPQR